jgi:hypothetical protein
VTDGDLEVMSLDVEPSEPTTTAPRRRRWPWVVVGAVLVVFLLVPVAAVGLVYATHPRDERAYINNLHQFTKGPAWDQIWQKGDAFVIAEGDRACGWLSEQPYAGLRHDAQFQDGYMARRWWRFEKGSADPLWFAENGGSGAPIWWLATRAWNYLCPASWYLHKPHYPFGDPYSD